MGVGIVSASLGVGALVPSPASGPLGVASAVGGAASIGIAAYANAIGC